MRPPEPSRLWRRAAVPGAVLASWLVSASVARAEPSYPGDVDTALGKPTIVEDQIAPPMGCQLCHTSSQGGTTTLSPFGNYMVAFYGLPDVAAAEDSQVALAFGKLKAAEPKLWADMQAGIDPNNDPVFTEGAPPQPQYGCAVPASPAPASPWSAAAAVLSVAVVATRRRRAGDRY